MADFANLKVPHTLGHSRGVARLAVAGAEAIGDVAAVVRLRRAALLHGPGRAGISNQIWDKPGPLSGEEWERVRLYPYLTERILHRCPGLRGYAGLAGASQERLDGSGYYRGSTGRMLDTEQRILAAAVACHAMSQPRAHRPALAGPERIAALTRAVAAGRLDGPAVAAVVPACGGDPSELPVVWPRGLTGREVEVLRLACQGMSISPVAPRLVISPNTEDRHLQNSYAKIGVSSRAAAALLAVEQGLLGGMG